MSRLSQVGDGRILEVGHVAVGAGVQRVDDHLRVDRAGDLDAAVEQRRRQVGDAPVAVADVRRCRRGSRAARRRRSRPGGRGGRRGVAGGSVRSARCRPARNASAAGVSSCSCPGELRVTSMPARRGLSWSAVLPTWSGPCDEPEPRPYAPVLYLTKQLYQCILISYSLYDGGDHGSKPGPRGRPVSPTRRDRLKPLRAFCQTARLGSVSRAAEALYVSQPAITLQLQALERELGVKLFERSRPPADPEPRGPGAVRTGQAAGRGPRRAGRGLPRHRSAGLDAGELNVAAGSSTILYLLPGIVEAFRAAPARRAPDPAQRHRRRAAWTCCAPTRSTWRWARCSTCPPTSATRRSIASSRC